MTKQDYIKIAEVLNANHAELYIVLDMADMLGEDNERFDRGRFVRASTEWAVEQEEYKRLLRAREELI